MNSREVDFDEFNFQLIRILSMESPISRDEYLSLNGDEIVEALFKVLSNLQKKIRSYCSTSIPGNKRCLRKQCKTV